MQRQRQLEEAMLHQMDPLTVLTRFERIARAGSHTVTTDVPQALLGEFAGLAVRTRGQAVKNVEFIPSKGWDPEHPDYARIHATVQQALR